ncbi:MAG: hypothetical protein ACI86X_001742 [Moritella sp.]|jgi:hypothetical protein
MSHYNGSKHALRNRNSQQAQSQTNPTTQAPLYFALLLAIGIVPFFIHNQPVTGVFVNFILIFTCLKLGIRSALPLAFVPSIAAVSSGMFPLALAPMIPFIMLGNILLILIVHLFQHNDSLFQPHYFVSLTLAALAKFALLYSTSHFLAQHFLPQMWLDKVMVMMSWPQFATAMVGGIFAFLVMKGLSMSGK